MSVPERGLIARASTSIRAPRSKVWGALTNPAMIRVYMFGTTVTSDWSEGGSIRWKGEWRGTRYEDKGTILKLRAPRLLEYSHFSPLSGLPDVPENYHTVTIELSETPHETLVSLSQDRNSDEAARLHSQKNWEAMLVGLKEFVESGSAPP